jgi:hypothetical protein
MDASEGFEELLDHLGRVTRLDRAEASRVVIEVLAYFSESPDEFVTRRHGELRREQLANPAIFERIESEIRTRRFRAPRLSLRQLRRLVYG